MARFNLTAVPITQIRKNINLDADSVGDLYEVVFSLNNREYELLQKKRDSFKKHFESVTKNHFTKQSFDEVYAENNYSFSGKIIGSDKVENWIIL